MIGPLLAAIAFLTRLPVPASLHKPSNDVQRSARWFPLVGVLLGSIYAASAWLAIHRFSASVVAALILGLDALLTGALHLDGLADMADGFGGGKTRADVLRIMRDHSIGSYGAAALMLLLLFKAACLSDLLSSPDGIWILFIAPTLSRWSILLLTLCAPYARRASDGAVGTGALSLSFTKLDFAIATAFCAPLLLFPSMARTLFCWVAVAVCTLCIAGLSRRRIGGFTGDVLGANVVLSEALQLAAAILVSPR